MTQRCPKCGRFASVLVGLNGVDMCLGCFDVAMKIVGKTLRELRRAAFGLVENGRVRSVELEV